jgi:hypothetical protein
MFVQADDPLTTERDVHVVGRKSNRGLLAFGFRLSAFRFL